MISKGENVPITLNQCPLWCCIHMVPSIGEVRYPAILFNLTVHSLSPLHMHCALSAVATLCDLEVCIYGIFCHMYTSYFAMTVSYMIQRGCDKGSKLQAGMVTLWQANSYAHPIVHGLFSFLPLL